MPQWKGVVVEIVFHWHIYLCIETHYRNTVSRLFCSSWFLDCAVGIKKRKLESGVFYSWFRFLEFSTLSGQWYRQADAIRGWHSLLKEKLQIPANLPSKSSLIVFFTIPLVLGLFAWPKQQHNKHPCDSRLSCIWWGRISNVGIKRRVAIRKSNQSPVMLNTKLMPI